MKFPDPKAGDWVAVRTSTSTEPSREEISRVTATQVVTSGGRRFSRATGREVGAGYDSAWAEPWTKDVERWLAARRETAALEDRRRALRGRLDVATVPLWLTDDTRHRFDRTRVLTTAQLDEVEALVVDLERRVADLAARWDGDHA